MRNQCCYCPQLVRVVPSHPWHRNWLDIQPAWYGTGDQTCFSLHWLGAHEHLLYLSWKVETFYLIPTKARAPLIAHLNFLLVAEQSFHWLTGILYSSTVSNFRILKKVWNNEQNEMKISSFSLWNERFEGVYILEQVAAKEIITVIEK